MSSLWCWLAVLFFLEVRLSDASVDVPSVLRQISKRHAKIPGTGDNAVGAVVNVNGPCRWDAAAATCGIGYGPIADIFDASSNAYAQLVAQFAKCSSATDAEACSSTSNCSWDTDSLTCHFLDFYSGHEDSPCAVGASSFFTTLVAHETCKLHKTQLSCCRDPLCTWNKNLLVCDGDDFVSYIGISLAELTGASDAVVPFKVDELKTVFPSYYNTTSKDFEWEDILDWEVPDTGCPEWSDPLICTYTDGVLSLVAQSFYCGARYSSHDDKLRCALDPLCYIEPESGSCEQPDDTFLPGIYKGVKDAVSAYVEGALDKKILLHLLECSEIQTEDACKDPCLWVLSKETGIEIEECVLSGTWISDEIVDGGDDSDALCKMWSSLAGSKCVDIADPEACNAEPDCFSLLSGTCWVSVDYQAKDVVKTDADLKTAYDKLEEACSAHKSEEACHAKT